MGGSSSAVATGFQDSRPQSSSSSFGDTGARGGVQRAGADDPSSPPGFTG